MRGASARVHARVQRRTRIRRFTNRGRGVREEETAVLSRTWGPGECGVDDAPAPLARGSGYGRVSRAPLGLGPRGVRAL